MKRKDPILIAAPPRSGTTMIAGLLGKHGVWIGRGRTTKFPGTNPKFVSENQDIKKVFKRVAAQWKYENWNTPFPDFGRMTALVPEIEKFVPDNTPWLVKTSWNLIFWKFWFYNYPEARWVFPRRDTLKIVDSMNRHPAMQLRPDAVKHRYISHLLQNTLLLTNSGVNYTVVDVEQLASQDDDAIDVLFDFVGLEPDFAIINEWLDPKILHK